MIIWVFCTLQYMSLCWWGYWLVKLRDIRKKLSYIIYVEIVPFQMYKKYILVGQYLATSWIKNKLFILTRKNAFFVSGRLDFLEGAFSFSVILFSSPNFRFSSLIKCLSCSRGCPRKKVALRNRKSGFPFIKFQIEDNKIGMQVETALWVAAVIYP